MKRGRKGESIIGRKNKICKVGVGWWWRGKYCLGVWYIVEIWLEYRKVCNRGMRWVES